MQTFQQFLEEKSIKEKKEKGKIQMSLNIEGEPVLVGKNKKSKSLKRVLDVEGEPETI